MESGNKYDVSSGFHELNGKLLMFAAKNSSKMKAISPTHQRKAIAILKHIFHHSELRNRNPLHPCKIDSLVIGNLLNFHKHIFGFPYASHATDGNESLSLVLYSYRQLHEQRLAAAAVSLTSNLSALSTDLGASHSKRRRHPSYVRGQSGVLFVADWRSERKAGGRRGVIEVQECTERLGMLFKEVVLQEDGGSHTFYTLQEELTQHREQYGLLTCATSK